MNSFRLLPLLFLAVAPAALGICHPQPECEENSTAPSVTLTAPVNGATATAPGAFTLTAAAYDDSSVDSVEFFSNNVSVGVDSSAPYSILLSGLATGSYAIKARATDDSGMFANSSIATVTVTTPTNSPPTVTLTSPANGATATSPGSFVISATASDSDGSIASVKFKNGSTVLNTDTTYPYSYTWSGVAAGSYAITAVATDISNAATSSATADVTVSTVPNTPPTIALTAPGNGNTVNASTVFTLSATAADSDGSIASVKFLVNGALVATDGTSPYSFGYSTATAGSAAIQAIATDNTGAATASSTANITIVAPGNVAEVRSYVYDAHERLCKTINPESGATVVEYDVVGNILWTADGQALPSTSSCDRSLVAAGAKTTRSYDDMNRVTALSTPGGTADMLTTYYPDGAVHTISAANPGGNNVITTYSYNKRRMLTTETQVNGSTSYTLGYGYSANGHLSAIGYPDGEQVNYTPDALGRATLVAGNTATYASGITYYPNGAIAGFKYGAAAGGGPSHTMTRNARGLPMRSQDVKGTTVILDDTYAYDANGNVTDITDAAQGGLTTRGMAYDDLDRLTSAVAPGLWGNGNYTYDALDNLKTADRGTRQYRYNYDPTSFRLLNVKDAAGTLVHSFGYDANGNTTAKNSQALVFDGANRLSQVTGSQTYRYDGLGRRVQTTDADGKTTFWVYSQAGQVLYTSEARRSRNLAYVYLGNTQIATRSRIWASPYTDTVRYQMTDALGSPVADTNVNGGAISRTSYTAWGEATPSVDGAGFTGHVSDAGTGFIYMQQRYYDPQIGRFLSVDPAESEFNRYNYASNNPYRFVDPDGREAKEEPSRRERAEMRRRQRLYNEGWSVDSGLSDREASAGDLRKKYGVGTQGTGHHWVPFDSTTDMDLSSHAREVFGQSTSGEPIPSSIHNTDHPGYNDAVRKELTAWSRQNRVDPARMTSAQARAFVSHIRGGTSVPRINGFVTKINQFNDLIGRFGSPGFVRAMYFFGFVQLASETMSINSAPCVNSPTNACER